MIPLTQKFSRPPSLCPVLTQERRLSWLGGALVRRFVHHLGGRAVQEATA